MSVFHSRLATGNIVDVWLKHKSIQLIDFLKVGFYQIMDQELFITIYNLSSFEIMFYCPNILGS